MGKSSFAVYQHNGNFLLKLLVEVSPRFDIDLLEFKGNLRQDPQDNLPGDHTQGAVFFRVQLDLGTHGERENSPLLAWTHLLIVYQLGNAGSFAAEGTVFIPFYVEFIEAHIQ